MGKMLFVSLKLAFAMVCVGASLILGAQWLGIIPDQSRELMRSRHALSEAVAINASSHVRKQQWLDLQTTLQTLVDRDPDLLSIGLRTDLGGMRSATKSHDLLWSSQDMKDSGIDIIPPGKHDTLVTTPKPTRIPLITILQPRWIGRIYRIHDAGAQNFQQYAGGT